MTKKKASKPGFWQFALVGLGALILAGCPLVGSLGYDIGFIAGFAQDYKYWDGFADSYNTVDGSPILYRGNEIPFIDDDSYQAGFNDGLWYAYNDGYFVDYDYAFTIGFSEGYDVANQPDGVAFLAEDQHIEWLDGGFSDGYNDGFSEGRVFGAFDYGDNFNDWLDALLDYRDGTDLSFDDIGVGTGVLGPVFLYEYGTDPFELIGGKSAAHKRKGNHVTPTIRRVPGIKMNESELSYRPLIGEFEQGFDVSPTSSPRSTRELRLTSTWLQRIEAYLAASGVAKQNRKRLQSK